MTIYLTKGDVPNLSPLSPLSDEGTYPKCDKLGTSPFVTAFVTELENFSRNTPIAIEQDFYATIYLSNLMAMAKNEANEETLSNGKNLKYEYKVNMNMLIPKTTKVLINCFYEENPGRRNKLFDKAMSNITKNLVPIGRAEVFPEGSLLGKISTR
ncbi:MAG: hypothetical protein ACOX0L_06855 [Natronincolaceae bacterium]|jgi:hypothetical protein